MGDQELIFDVAELATISVECPHCHNVIAYDARTPETFGVPMGCQTCQRPLGPLAQCLAAYRSFYRMATEGSAAVRLRLTVRTSPATCPVVN